MATIMLKKRISNFIGLGCITLMFAACLPSLVRKNENKNVPSSYNSSKDTVNSAPVSWKEFFKDSNLVALIETAVNNNQSLKMIEQEIIVAQQEIRARKGKYLPFLSVMAGAGGDKEGRYTRLGALDANQDIVSGQSTPNFLPDYLLAANVSWQVDIWKQLRNAKTSAVKRWLASVEGRKFMQTKIVAEIAYNYYELMALDNQLAILQANIAIQKNALNIVTLQKAAGQVTELAVLRFQAEVTKNQSRQYYIQQRIIEAQNRINFLAGRFPQPVQRNSQSFAQLAPDSVYMGIPSQLLENRKDIKEAEQQLLAYKLDVKVAKANFYPVFNITGGIGYDAFNAKYLFTTPESMLFNLAGSLVAPLVNRNAIKAMYVSANAKQIEAVYNYERTILMAYTEVANQQANINNLANSFNYKSQQVDALNHSINISINLFKSAQADYVEVLLTQRDALESKIELIETKKQQLNAMVSMYQALGGGW